MLNMLTRFWQPKEVVTKKGSIARLRYLEAKKVALVCGRQSIDDSGLLGRIESYFEVAKIDRIVC